MELRAGYKQTAVGVIPKSWDVANLGDLGSVVRGGSPRPAGDPRFFNGSFIPWLTVAALTNISENEMHVSETVGFLTEEGAKHSRTLEQGTLIIANSGATLGVVKILGVKCCANDGIAAIVNHRNGDKEFVCHYVNTRTKYLREVVATGNGQPNLNTTLIKNIAIPFPAVAEQRAIATALSDVDALLAKIDQLITKKRDLKQGAMQQLLTGQTRLPGFSGEWEVKPMKSLGQTYGGLAGKTKEDFGHGSSKYIPFMNVMTDTVIDPNWLETVDIAQNEAQNLAKKGDLFFNGSSETPEEVGFCSVLLEDIPNLYLNSFCFGFRFNTDAKVSGLFFAYWFRGADGRAAMSVLAQGATRYNIAKSAFMRLSISQPSQEEQTAIARVLTDMDTELAALEARRDKTRALKQGMMQALLTGRIRLVGAN